MIEINWGEPVSLVSVRGDRESFSTFEKARYWLRRRWPVSDTARDHALTEVQAALDCIVPAETARRAFLAAALTAGYAPHGKFANPDAAID